MVFRGPLVSGPLDHIVTANSPTARHAATPRTRPYFRFDCGSSRVYSKHRSRRRAEHAV